MSAVDDGRVPRQIVTGSSGFIGTHLCARLPHCIGGIDVEAPGSAADYRHISADIRCLDRLREIAAASGRADTVFHLAASAEVLTPWSDVPRLLSSNLEGTYNVVEALAPRLLIFASSSSVYGNAGLRPVDPRTGAVQPLCLYAMSKLGAEMIVRDWVRQSGGAAVIFRFGNVIGAGCRGLISYLIRHALRHPHGGVAARLRGRGRLVRDYVPVDYVVRVLMAAARAKWAPRSVVTLNVGGGRAMTNRQVAEFVRQVAGDLGFRLDVRFDDPVGPGEAEAVVLDMKDTVKLLGLDPPDPAEVRQVIAETVIEYLRGAHAERRLEVISETETAVRPPM